MTSSNTKAQNVIAGAALALSVGLLACSGTTPSTGSGGGGGFNGPTNSSMNQGTQSGSSSGSGSNQSSGTGSSGSSATTGGSSGGSSGSNGGSNGVGVSSGSSSGSSASHDAGATGSSGGTGSSGVGSSGGSIDGIPTAPGITVGPVGATDLPVPPAADGIQFATPVGTYSVAPGQEIFPNYCVTVPTDVQVGGFQSWMSEGSSHHFIVYKGNVASAGAACSMGAFNWLYATSTPGQVVTENFPPNVGLSLAANTQLILNLHFINPGSTTLTPQIKLNIIYAKNVKYQAAAMVSFNVSINIPAATAAGPGTQTVSGTCTAPVGSNFFTMSTHTHKHATAAWIDYIHNGQTTEVVHTGMTSTYPADQEPGSGTDWEHPGVGLWTAPNFLTVQQGDSFTYHCSYTNTQSNAVTVGETAANNEMCMAVTYYYPAGNASCN